MEFKETRFATMEDIKSNAIAELRKILKEAFRRCFQQWQYDGRGVCAQGFYFEGYKVTLPYILPLQCNTTVAGTF
jgi:hypothetical protein